MIKWSLVKSLGDSKVVQSSFVWLFIVPMTARLLSKVDDVLNFTIFGSEISVATSLPFSWQLLFGAACSFTIANIIYNSFCPEIYRGYKNYSEFKDHGKTLLQIHSAMKSMVWSDKKPGVNPEYVRVLSSYFTNYCEQRPMTEAQLDNSIEQFDNIKKANVGLLANNAFYFAQNTANGYNSKAITSCLIFYCVGLVLISIIAIQNAVYVVNTFS